MEIQQKHGFLSINMVNKWIVWKLNQVHKCHQIAKCIIVNSHSNE
jgi:hypothetical protein